MISTVSGIQITRYWTLTPRVAANNAKEEDLIEGYESLVQSAVRMQMQRRASGIFLSSGVDSGALLAIMGEFSGGRCHTFTIGFRTASRTRRIRLGRWRSSLERIIPSG